VRNPCLWSVQKYQINLTQRCKVEYTNANQGIMTDSHDIWVQYTESDLDNTFQDRVPSLPVLYSCWTPLNQILQFQVHLAAGNTISIFSNWCRKTQQWIVHPQVQKYAVVVSTKYKDRHGWADCIDWFIRVVKQTNMMQIVPVAAIVGRAHLVRENVASDSIDSIWLVINHVDLDVCWSAY